MESIEQIKKENTEFQTGGTAIEAEALALVVDSQTGLEMAGDIVKRSTEARKAITAKMKEPKAAAKAAHTAMCDLEKDFLKPFLAAEGDVLPKATAYQNEQERIRKEEEAKAEAEQRRVEREATEKREAEEKAHAEKVAKAEAEGRPAPEPEPVPVEEAPYVPPATTRGAEKVTGLSFRTKISGVIVDKEKLLFAIVDDKDNTATYELIEFKQSKIDDLVKAGINLPGVKRHEEKTPVRR